MSASSASASMVDVLFEGVPHVFGSDQDAYLTWRREAASRLDVDPRNVILVGSAALGRSLVKMTEFTEASDVDLAVISARHFDEAWRFLRSAKIGTLKCTTRQREHIRNYAAQYVYRGCIATDRILPLLRFGPDWQRTASYLGNALPPDIGAREVNFRLYRDIEALRSYQEYSHHKCTTNGSG